MAEVANRICTFLYDELRDASTGERQCVLVRLFKTHAYGVLDDELRRCADRAWQGRPPDPETKCLVLLGSVGDKPEWCSTQRSASHRCIPLASEDMAGTSPMIAELLSQLGVPVGAVLRRDPKFILEADEQTYNVFFVAEATGSAYVPAQREFVEPHGIRSVLGFGGVLPLGEPFAAILFTRVPVPEGSVDLFRTIALSAKAALLPHVGGATFTCGSKSTTAVDGLESQRCDWKRARLGAQAAALEQLLDVHERVALEYVQKLTVLEEVKRSNESLQQFASVVSHDLQEPLRMVTSFTQLLSRRYAGKLGPDADEYIRFAVDGAKRMQELLNDVLTYSRVTINAKLPEPTDAERVLEGVKANLRGAIEEAGAAVEHDPLPTVVVDKTQLTQLFQNLIDNAIKFRRDGGPHVHVSAARDGGMWRFSIRDDGIGIETQYFDRIFQMFQRLHTRTEYPGTGIGLAICKRIVERHRGRIWVESEPGQGSSFHFTIPAQTAG